MTYSRITKQHNTNERAGIFMKKVKLYKKSLIIIVLCFAIIVGTTTAYASTSDNATYTQVSETEIGINAINDSWILQMLPGTILTKEFTMNKIFTADHNAFTIKMSSISGQYKVYIAGSNGYVYNSSVYTTDCTFTTTNCKDGVTYTYIIYNVSTSANLYGNCIVKSYIE